MLFPLTQASWMSMNSPRPTISRDLLLQRELLQQEPRTPGLGWGISDRRYLGSFTPALTRAKARECGAANLEVIRGGFLSYKHVGDGVDFAYTRNALHHLPDFWKALALRRIARLLKPGGILRLRDLTFSFQLGESDRRVEAWLNATAVRPESGWTRSELET